GGESWFEGMNELISAFGYQNELDAIAPLARQLARKAPRKGDKRAWLDALTSAARWLVPAGRIALAADLLDTISAERQMLSGGLAVRVFLLRGEIARMRGDLVTFVESGQAAMAICETTGDIRTLSEVLMELGCGMQELGLLEEA